MDGTKLRARQPQKQKPQAGTNTCGKCDSNSNESTAQYCCSSWLGHQTSSNAVAVRPWSGMLQRLQQQGQQQHGQPVLQLQGKVPCGSYCSVALAEGVGGQVLMRNRGRPLRCTFVCSSSSTDAGVTDRFTSSTSLITAAIWRKAGSIELHSQ